MEDLRQRLAAASKTCGSVEDLRRIPARLCHSVSSIESHVYKEHLMLISNYMCFSGKIIGFTSGGYRHLLQSMRLSAPFAEVGMERSLKCFEKAAKRSQEDTLSSTLTCCSWGQFPLVGTGGNFKILWNNNEQASGDPSDPLFKHDDVYDFLENIGIIPQGKDGLSSENYLDETLYGEMDEASEVISPDVIFVDTSREKGMANFIDKDSTPLCDLSAKSSNRINDNNKTNNLSGWEASRTSDSETDGWACGARANKETGDQKSGSQLKIATQWDTNSTLVDDSTNAFILDGQGSRWTPNLHSPGKRNSKSCWLEDRIADVQGQKLRSDTKGKVNSTGDCSNHEIYRARKDDYSSVLEPQNKSGWESVLQETEVENLPGWKSSVESSGMKCKNEKEQGMGKSQEDEVTNASCWNSYLEPERKYDCIGGWTKDASYSELREDAWKCHDLKSAWELDLQEINGPNDSGWKTQVETAGGINSAKKRAAGTNWTSNYPAWQSNKDDRSAKDCTDWNNLCSETIQEDDTKLHDNQLNPYQYSRFQPGVTFQREMHKKKKILEVNDNMQCWSEKLMALQASKNPDFPPGFSSVKGSYKETVPLQQIENEISFPSGTAILKTSGRKDYADEQGQHELISCDIKSDNTLKSNLTSANIILGKGSCNGIQWEAHNKNTSQDVEQRQRTTEEAQATGWSVDWQAEVSETSWTTSEARVIEAQATRWRIDQRIYEETQPTGWSVDQHAEVPKTSWTTLETMVERLSEDRSSEKNVFEQEQVGYDNTREPLSVGNLASPVWTKLLKGEQDECKLSSSFRSHKFKPTGANLVPIGTRSYKKSQSKSYEKIPVRECVQDQTPSTEMQRKDWGLNCHVEEGRCKSCMAGETDGKCKYSESNAQNALLLRENSSVSVDLHTPRRFGEDVLMNGSSNLETEKNVLMTENIAVRASLDSSGWGLENQNDSTTSGWGLENQKDSTTSGWELPSQSDPSPLSSWELPNESDPPTMSNWELQNHIVYRPDEKLCVMKSMEDVRRSNDKSTISSLRSTKRDWVHLTRKTGSDRSSRMIESLTGVIDRPSKLQEIFHEINPLMHSMRMILHYGSYNSGDRLRPEDQREVLEKVLIHHPEAEAKIGCGVDFIVVDNHAQFSSTRCFYIVRRDGTRTDFSYLKCLKGLVEKKFPDSAKDFIQKYIERN